MCSKIFSGLFYIMQISTEWLTRVFSQGENRWPLQGAVHYPAVAPRLALNFFWIQSETLEPLLERTHIQSCIQFQGVQTLLKPTHEPLMKAPCPSTCEQVSSRRGEHSLRGLTGCSAVLENCSSHILKLEVSPWAPPSSFFYVSSESEKQKAGK